MKPSVWRTASVLLLTVGGCMAASGFTVTGAHFWARTGELAGVVTLVLAVIWFMSS